MKLLLCLLVVAFVAVESAPVNDERAFLKRLLGELRKRRVDDDAQRVWVDWDDEVNPDEGLQVNATWVMPDISDFLNDLFADSNEEGDDADDEVEDEGWWAGLFDDFSEEDEEDANDKDDDGGWWADFFDDSTEEEDKKPKSKTRRLPAKKRIQSNSLLNSDKPNKPDKKDNLEQAEEDFEEVFGQGSGSGLSLFVELLPAILGNNMEGVVDDWQGMDYDSLEAELPEQQSGSGDEGKRPDFEDWFNNLNWEGMVNDWLDELEDIFSGSGMSEVFEGRPGGQGRPRPPPGGRRPHHQKRASRDDPSKNNKLDFQQHWQDIDWAGINSAIQDAFDRTKEHYDKLE